MPVADMEEKKIDIYRDKFKEVKIMRKNKNKSMLDKAIKYWGKDDIVTKMLMNREKEKWNKQYNHQLT